MSTIDYIFAGREYVRVTRDDDDAGSIDAGYPKPILNWDWGSFGANGIDAALYSGAACYFFSGNEYIRVTRGQSGAGAIDPGYPKPISNWGWGSFGANGIDAALYSGYVCYFFSGKEYIRVRRGQSGAGTIDAGYPKPISNWGWGSFGADGIDAALYSGSKCYFFSGTQYIRVSRSEQSPGSLDPGYPKPISNWGWGSFGADGISDALYSGGPLAEPPDSFGSNHNYYLASNGSDITWLTVTINIDEDIVGTEGVAFQLNAYGASNTAAVGQQYCLLLDPTVQQMKLQTEFWPVLNPSPEETASLFNKSMEIVPMSENRIPAGYTLEIALENDSSNRITSAKFTVVDDRGTSTIQPITFTDLTATNGNPVTDADLAPITAFQLNVVGYDGEVHTQLSSGAGTLTFTAMDALTASAKLPPDIDQSYQTDETANSVYGLMPATASTSLTQSFEAAVA
jgi:hypothetical protein